MNTQIIGGLLMTFMVPIFIGIIILILITRAIFSIGRIVNLLEKIEKNTRDSKILKNDALPSSSN